MCNECLETAAVCVCVCVLEVENCDMLNVAMFCGLARHRCHMETQSDEETDCCWLEGAVEVMLIVLCCSDLCIVVCCLLKA